MSANSPPATLRTTLRAIILLTAAAAAGCSDPYPEISGAGELEELSLPCRIQEPGIPLPDQEPTAGPHNTGTSC